MLMFSRAFSAGVFLTVISLTFQAAAATDVSQLEGRIERLEEMNARLIELLATHGISLADDDSGQPPTTIATNEPPVQIPATEKAKTTEDTNLVGLSSAHTFKMLDHAENVNTKPVLLLDAIQAGNVKNKATLGVGVTAIADYQASNSDSKFGYLMRHPTSANQIGDRVSEIALHSAQVSFTGKLTDDLTAHAELLYNPQQSFGAGTITDLNRNQIQLRRGFLLWGNLDKSPLYAAIGKMDTPFGLNDTVNPFTNTTVWHAFAGLAYGGTVGYYDKGLHIRAMGIQGGAQFRAANAPVKGTSVPSKLNNFAVDANYTAQLGDQYTVLVGGSYQRGSAYCQDYPVVHFEPCESNNPAFATYTRVRAGRAELIGEFAQTTKVWAGTAVPAVDPRLGGFVRPPQQLWAVAPNPLSVFEAQKTSSFAIGGRYELGQPENEPGDFLLSLEFSKFIAGEDGSPWRRQNQYVAGVSKFLSPSVNVFGEYIRTNGYVPLNFLSGGNFADGGTWSEVDAKSDVVLVGLQTAF